MFTSCFVPIFNMRKFNSQNCSLNFIKTAVNTNFIVMVTNGSAVVSQSNNSISKFFVISHNKTAVTHSA